MAAVKQLSYEATGQRPAYSLLRHSPAFVVLVIAIADALQLADPDLWNHLRAGQIILNTRHLVLYEPFSYTAFGQLWRNHEWLFQVAFAAAYDRLGVFGLKLIKLLCAAATISLIALGLTETEAPARVQRAVLAVIAVALVPQIEFRPQLATFALLSLVMVLLARDTYRARTRLWPLVPIFALWANLHGGYLVGVAALATYAAIVGADELRRGHGYGRGARLAATAAACAFATIANPEGIGIWRTVMHSIRDPLVHNGVTEWQPLLSRIGFQWHDYVPGVIMYLLPLALFVALALSLLLAPGMDDAALVAIAALFIIGAFISARHMALAVIALSIPLARHFGILLSDPSASLLTGLVRTPRVVNQEPAPIAADADWRFNPMAAIGLAIAIAAANGLLSNRLTIDEHCPVGAVAFMKQHHLHGNMLGDYDWGGYLIWHIVPQSKVFIDGRCEVVYPARVISDYYDLYFGFPSADSVLDGYPHDFVLLPPGSKGYGLVAKNPNWKLIYRDPDAGLFARATSPAALLPGIPVIGSVSAKKFFP